MIDKKKGICYAISQEFFGAFLDGKCSISIKEYLENSYCDEICYIDAKKKTYTLASHVEGKYLSPVTKGSYEALFDFVCKEGVHPQDYEMFSKFANPDTILRNLAESPTPNFAFIHIRLNIRNGSYRWFEQGYVAGREHGYKDGLIGVYLFDIHNAKMRELGKNSNERSILNNEFDGLTGVYKEKAFIQKAEKMAKTKKNWAIISTDIEHFKLYDEWYGREQGNLLLSSLGKLFNKLMKKYGGAVGYPGQDDFFLMLPYNEENIETIFDEVRKTISIQNQSVGFMPAFGVCLLKDAKDVVDALDKSSVAAYKAKTDIQKRIYVYNPEEQKNMEDEYHVLLTTIKALKNNEMTFYLQPQVRISTGNIVGAEALARWITPEGKVVPPGHFIPVLERFGFITDLDLDIWEKVFMWLADLLHRGINPVPVSINVSRVDIFRIDIEQTLLSFSEKYSVPTKLIKVEITESAYAENTSYIENLVKGLREKGFMVLMDDFGSGYSSLNMLSNIEVDAIKLDALFLKMKDSKEEVGVKILESVINMAKQIGLPMIVEGVEDKSQIDFLANLGCRYVQGFYFYRPIPQHEFEEILKNEEKIDNRGFVIKANEQFRMREFLDANIYSDTMLNNIIGPTAIYVMNEDSIDIVRYNQQFYQSVSSKEFVDRLNNMDKYMPKEDRERIFKALREAKENKLNGAKGVFRFYKENGELVLFNIQFYYLNEAEGSSRFFGSAVNVTEFYRLKDEMEIISNRSSKTIIFAVKNNNTWVYSVGSHGLEKYTKYGKKEFENILNNPDLLEKAKDSVLLAEIKNALTKRKKIEKEITFITKDNKELKLTLVGEPISTYSMNANFLFILKKE